MRGPSLLRSVTWPLLGCALLLAAGQYFGDYLRYVLALVAINAMVVISLDVLLGRLGLISIGHAGFVGIGAYSSAILAIHHWPFIITIPVAGLIATICGVLLGLPSMRLSGFYLAIASIAFGAIVEQFVRWAQPITGGGFGLQVPDAHLFVTLNSREYLVLIVAVLVLYVIGAAYLSRTVTGRAMAAVKSSEPAAQAVGINVTVAKLMGFAISGFGAGAAGALYGPLVGFIGPEHFTFLNSVSYIAMAVLGGPGVLGALIGAAVITALPELFSSLQDYASLVWGVAMLLILIISPAGMVDLRRRWGRASRASTT